MNWTKKIPTKEGYYWINEHLPNGYIEIVYVSKDGVSRTGLDVEECFDKEKGFFTFDSLDPEWYGPLQPPDHLSKIDP
jgi:hypothetical protein